MQLDITAKSLGIWSQCLMFTVGLFASINIAQAADHSNSVKTDLSDWQTTYDGLRDMTPKWGKQSVHAFYDQLEAGETITFVDVRTPKEWQQGTLPNALKLNLNELYKAEVRAKLPKDLNTKIGVYCKARHRSTMALVMLHYLGYKNAINMDGGFVAWKNADYPIKP